MIGHVIVVTTDLAIHVSATTTIHTVLLVNTSQAIHVILVVRLLGTHTTQQLEAVNGHVTVVITVLVTPVQRTTAQVQLVNVAILLAHVQQDTLQIQLIAVDTPTGIVLVQTMLQFLVASTVITTTAQQVSVALLPILVQLGMSQIPATMETTPTGTVLAQTILQFLVAHTTTITTTTITAVSLCLQTLIIQIVRAVGHVTLVSSKSTICVFGGTKSRESQKSPQNEGFLFAFLGL